MGIQCTATPSCLPISANFSDSDDTAVTSNTRLKKRSCPLKKIRERGMVVTTHIFFLFIFLFNYNPRLGKHHSSVIRNILNDHTIGTYLHIISNHYTWQNFTSCSQQYIVTNHGPAMRNSHLLINSTISSYPQIVPHNDTIRTMRQMGRSLKDSAGVQICTERAVMPGICSFYIK